MSIIMTIYIKTHVHINIQSICNVTYTHKKDSVGSKQYYYAVLYEVSRNTIDAQLLADVVSIHTAVF